MSSCADKNYTPFDLSDCFSCQKQRDPKSNPMQKCCNPDMSRRDPDGYRQYCGSAPGGVVYDNCNKDCSDFFNNPNKNTFGNMDMDLTCARCFRDYRPDETSGDKDIYKDCSARNQLYNIKDFDSYTKVRQSVYNEYCGTATTKANDKCGSLYTFIAGPNSTCANPYPTPGPGPAPRPRPGPRPGTDIFMAPPPKPFWGVL